MFAHCVIMANISRSPVELDKERRKSCRNSSVRISIKTLKEIGKRPSDSDMTLPTRRRNLAAHFGIDESVSKDDITMVNINSLPRDRNITDSFCR